MSNARFRQPGDQADLDDWLDYIGQIHTSAIDLGLERIRRVAAALELPSQPKATVFTVAGTNGKGSTTKAISELCIAAGQRVGLYQSPHVYQFNERIQINGMPASDQQILAAIRVVDATRIEIGESLSFFETTTLAAFMVFMQSECSVWVLEVGLGGRLDATNLIDCDVGVVVSIALDHADWLGSDLEVIGYEKAGILRPAKPAVLGHDLTGSVASHARHIGARIIQAEEDFTLQDLGHQWIYSSPAVTLRLDRPKLALPNVSLALTAVMASPVSIDLDQISGAMSRMMLMGRFEVRKWMGRTLILDALHNPAGARFFVKQLSARLGQGSVPKGGQPKSLGQDQISLVFSMLLDKDISGVVSEIYQAYPCAQWFVAPITDPHLQNRAASLSDLRKVFDGLNLDTDQSGEDKLRVGFFSDLQQAFGQADLLTPSGGTIVICGSFHALHEAQQPYEK